MLPIALLGVATAPADRYFGKLKMSALRVRYETMQLKTRYENHRLLPQQTLHLAVLTEDAFRQWAKAYPKDPWLPSTGYAMAQLYQELPGTLARDRAVALLVFVKSRFPKTVYAQKARDQLHLGVPVKSPPAWAMRTTVPSPAPSVTSSSNRYDLALYAMQ